MTDRNMEVFLSLVPLAGWRDVPRVWSEQFREALSGGLVKVGWGGVIELTDAGETMRTQPSNA